MKYLSIKYIYSIFYKQQITYLGRWSIIYNKPQLDQRIKLANYDNCGVSHLKELKYKTSF